MYALSGIKTRNPPNHLHSQSELALITLESFLADVDISRCSKKKKLPNQPLNISINTIKLNTIITLVCGKEKGENCWKLIIATFVLIKDRQVCTSCSHMGYSVSGVWDHLLCVSFNDKKRTEDKLIS